MAAKSGFPFLLTTLYNFLSTCSNPFRILFVAYQTQVFWNSMHDEDIKIQESFCLIIKLDQNDGSLF